MKTYDAVTKEEIESPDLVNGYVYAGKLFKGTEKVVLNGTVDSDNPEGLFHEVAVYEECMYYRRYTAEDVETYKSNKISELQLAQDNALASGTTVKLSDGTEKLFNYDSKKQTEVSQMFQAVMLGATAFPYHPSSGGCEIYSATDIVTIYATLSAFQTEQTTYCNQLCEYVRSLDNVPAISNVKYGDELTGAYLEKYQEMVSQAQEQMQKVLTRVSYSVY